MADNTDEEHLENPINNQAESPPDEITPIADAEIINPNQETENMEVHHHAHDPAAPHHKKNWKSYFWEFLMLFLAVFCGFLAEWQLEHTIENSREKEFIISMVKELENDDKQINQVLNDSVRNNKLDTLVIALLNLDNNANNIKTAYILEKNLNSYYPMIFSRSTISQLKNGGNMRLIRNRGVVDCINIIDRLIENMDGQIKSYDIDLMTTCRSMTKIFDIRYKYKFKIANTKLSYTEFIKQQSLVKYLTDDEKLRIEFAQQVSFAKDGFANYIGMIKNYQARSREIVVFIKKEYHLE